MTLPETYFEKVPEKYENNRYRLRLGAPLLFLLIIVILKESTAIYNIFDVSDYPTHIQVAESMVAGGPQIWPHWLYEALTIVIKSMMPGPTYRSAGLLVALLAASVLACVLATSLYRQMRGRYPWMAVLLALALMVSAPILLITFPSGAYFGYQYPYTYHNPSVAVMRPLAVIIFLYMVYAYVPPVARWGQIFMAAGLAFLLANAKPNYSIVLIPIAGLLSAYRLVRRRFVDLKMQSVILAMLGLVLVFQLVTFVDVTSPGGGFSFRPLEILLLYRNLTVGEIIIKQALSIAFPLAVLILYWRTAQHDTMLMLAWICSIVGTFYALCFVEVGRAADNNFYWSGEVTLFILFFASVHFWVRQMGGRFDLSKRPAQIVMVIWALHIISGVLRYIWHLSHVLF
jgi:hypothetical protein